MKHARFFSIFVALAVLGFGALGFCGLPLATFQGDLTRMSILPERSFGWTLKQPAINPGLMTQSGMKEADVLVVGDSFSDSRLWQTVLVQKGLKVRTEPWGSVQPGCADFTSWLGTQGFSGKYLVIEVVERNLESAIKESLSCTTMQYHANPKTDTSRSPPLMSFDINYGNYTGKLSNGIKIFVNLLKYQYLQLRPDFKKLQVNKDVLIARVANGCELFSHSACKDSLFLTWDKAEDVDTTTLDNIEKLNLRLSGLTPIWAVVPNRSTAYLYPDKQFWNRAEQRFRAPNLLRMTQKALEVKTIDLYPGNNTHLSTAGHLLMGEEILKAIEASDRR